MLFKQQFLPITAVPAPREMTNRSKRKVRATECSSPQAVPWGRQTANGSTATGLGCAPVPGAVRSPRPPGPCAVVPALRQAALRTPGRCCGNGQVTRLASEGLWDNPTLKRKVQQEPGDRKGSGLGTGHALLKAGEQSSCLCCQRNFSVLERGAGASSASKREASDRDKASGRSWRGGRPEAAVGPRVGR